MTSTLRAFLACCLWIAACGRTPVLKRAPARPPSPTLANDDTVSPPLPDSIVKRVAALEDSLARDSLGPRAPRWLWTLGTLTQRSLGELTGNGPGGEYARAHRQQYAHSEPDAEFIYNGVHFVTLAWRFPHDTLADHAAYELTNLGTVGECEGYVPCYVGRELFPLREFLERFPDSPFGREAVLRANAAFDSTFAAAPAPTDSQTIWEVDSAAIRAEIEGYDSTAIVLPPALRALALRTIERLRSQWGRPRRDTVDAEPGGIQVEFRSARCGFAFTHPESWDVAERPSGNASTSCEFEVRRRGRRHQGVRDGDVDAYAVNVSVYAKGVDDGLRDSGFQSDSGQWFAAAADKGYKLLARARTGAAWRGLTGLATMGCYRKDGSHEDFCYQPMAFVGTEKRSARIIAGQESTAVFDLLLRTISFP